MKITYSPQRDENGKHDKTYTMSASGRKIGITTKHENPSGRTVKFTFEPNDSSLRLTNCEAPTMEELKAKIRKQFL